MRAQVFHLDNQENVSVTAPRRPINALLYVHLRNIHRSTGAGRVARQLTEKLAAREDMNVRILADRNDHDRVVSSVGTPWDSYRYHLFSSDTSRQQARWLLLGSPKAERFWPEADIVHCTGESFVPASRSRLVATLHDAAHFEHDIHRDTLSQKKQRLKWRFLYRALCRKADVFHTVSRFSAERLGELFPEMRSRLRVVHNAVTDRFFEPVNNAGEAYLRRMGLSGRMYLLVPGGLHFRKNAELVLRAWPFLAEQVRDLRLVISGHSDPDFAARAQAVTPAPLLTGFVDDDELCALYSHAQAVWFPSRYEGFGLPVLEAMACGAPVVASEASAIPEVAGGAAILVDPSSVQENVDALRAILQDTALRSMLSEQGRRRAAQFTWTAAAAEMRGLYSSVM